MPNTVKVGLFATVTLVVLGYLIIRTEDFRLFRPAGVRLEALFETVAGLDDRSAVRTAGVRVGRVDGVELVGRQAVVGILLDEPLALTQGTRARIATLGLLGDRYVELIPGPPDAPPLPPDARIPGEAAASMDDVMASIANVGASIEKVTGQLTGERPLEGPMGRMVVNLEATTDELRQIIVENRRQLDATIGNFREVSAVLAAELPRISAQLHGVLAEIGGVARGVGEVVGENRLAVRQSLDNVHLLTERLQVGVEHLNEVSGRLARGEGTLGRLLTSDELHDELLATLDSVQGGVGMLSETLGVARDLRVDLAIQGFYLEGQEASQGSFRLDLDTQSGRLYRLAVVDDPTGRERRRVETITVTDPAGESLSHEIETITLRDDVTLSALLGLPIRPEMRLWTGIIQSKFGLQVDYQPIERWWVSAEAFDFDRRHDLDPHLRFTVGWKPGETLYLLGGYDDVLNEQRSFFLGAGLTWRDDTIKYLLGSMPRF
jgi:phospholipid/cholesterol/gamma-HCH transport system substrate-binding protein